MNCLRALYQSLRNTSKDQNFLTWLETLEIILAKILSLLLAIVIFLAVFDLIYFLGQELFISTAKGIFKANLFKIFGLFLNILIALELLENITGYLNKRVVQVELVIVTSLIAVARKIIILDLDKTSGIEIIGLGVAILSLSLSYWIIHTTNTKK